MPHKLSNFGSRLRANEGLLMVRIKSQTSLIIWLTDQTKDVLRSHCLQKLLSVLSSVWLFGRVFIFRFLPLGRAFFLSLFLFGFFVGLPFFLSEPCARWVRSMGLAGNVCLHGRAFPSKFFVKPCVSPSCCLFRFLPPRDDHLHQLDFSIAY